MQADDVELTENHALKEEWPGVGAAGPSVDDRSNICATFAARSVACAASDSRSRAE